ncbi:uncharacterized protein LOC128682102 isoform X2 [Plodia interpunctella]|uniref:uncharacterized protein LOC128682102 isoform X2 n=1 Tax=Plodia interpunctella TaxID=58824 RepID=UPI002367C5C0|nr:uncharacterized protein LOC128682102 isoform X2 [Plodia interpunctella]
MASSSRATTSEGPRYQGYPYVNLPAFGVPTIDSQTASRYANLPRRPLGTAVRVKEEGNTTRNNQDTKSPDSDEEPVLYIDMPGDGESDIYVRADSSLNQEQEIPITTQPRKQEDEEVVYIDLPECSGSGVSDRRPEDGPPTNILQDTIFYDQFKNRRIDVIQQSPQSGDYSSSASPRERPTTLNLWSPDSPPMITRPGYPQNVDRLRSIPEDFRLSPLPVTDYPDPPPAYTEIDFGTVDRPSSVGPIVQTTNSEASVSPEHPSRTRVIVHQNGGVTSNRKVLVCNICRVTVNSLVVRQVTYETHLVALFCFSIAMIPIVPLIYCCDICKSDVHYCPICNNKINKEFKFL